MAGHQCSVLSLSLTSLVLINFLYPIILGAPNQSPEFYRIHPLLSLRQKITELRNGYTTGEDPTENLLQNRSYMYDLMRREEAERSSNLQDVESQYDYKRNGHASSQCEVDADALCRGKRHPRCNVTFPESENAQDSNCKVKLDCAFTCSAMCFAVLHAFPAVLPNTQFRFSVSTSFRNRTAQFPHRTWNGKLNEEATNISLDILQNNGSIGGRFKITSTFNCSNLIPCVLNLNR